MTKRKQYMVGDEIFDVLCDASELSYQLCRKRIDKTNQTVLKLEKFDDLSWGIYDKEIKQWVFISTVEVMNI